MSESAALTPTMLAGTPVGGPGGMAVCDTCNRRLTDGHREHDPDDAEADTVFAYATRVRDTHRWTLRWASCEPCGPPGDSDETTESSEVIATATLTLRHANRRLRARQPPNFHPTPRRSPSRTVRANERYCRGPRDHRELTRYVEHEFPSLDTSINSSSPDATTTKKKCSAKERGE